MLSGFALQAYLEWDLQSYIKFARPVKVKMALILPLIVPYAHICLDKTMLMLISLKNSFRWYRVIAHNRCLFHSSLFFRWNTI